jgi:hypothetical protein
MKPKNKPTIVDLLYMPEAADIEFEPARLEFNGQNNAIDDISADFTSSELKPASEKSAEQ